ncbi:MAG TPA: type II toxin-antitoxin system VapC family toxin [Polyangiales bacterium]|nr:type II toxin-antitoxin system VapC family toxin [Polyangiales bacterium]
MIYLDSSALLKLLHDEAESDELAAWLAARAGTPVVSSELAKVEVTRACRRINPATLTQATTLLASLDLIPLSGTVIDEAANIGATTLRSLDALHLASALAIQAQLTAFIAYDHRLAEAASTAGLELLTPGV